MNAPRFASAILALFVGMLGLPGQAAESTSWLAELLNPELRHLDQTRAAYERELAGLGTPVVGQTAEQFGYQSPRLDAPPLNPAWVQVDLRSTQPIDWIALVPAQLEQSFDRTAYGFPKRFRVDVSDDREFVTFTTVADYTESDFPDPGVAPVAVKLTGQNARYVRVTVTKFALENGQFFFALAELMVLSGNRNIAINRPVSVSGRYELPPRWSQQNLVDGRTPLGPPIRKELLEYDGLFVDVPRDNSPPFMQVDLGRTYELQEVRLHPVHARIGADVPGFAFPKAFRVEASADAKFTTPVTLFESLDFPNPGNNPVTLPVSGAARAIRVVFLGGTETGPQHRFGLSEIQVYAGGVNVARQGKVTTNTPDTSPLSKDWPRSLLVDGFTSYGQLMELPDWLAMWTRRRALQTELATLAERRGAIAERTLVRGLRALGVITTALALSAFVISIRSRQRRKSEIEELRMRLARDLHDEIGSNLASLAVTGELAAESATDDTREDWREVQRVSRESMEAMREVLWVLGAREEAGIDLATRLQRTAQRMLARQSIQWQAPPQNPPTDWPAEARREVFLFFKETLANIVRHSRARHVEMRAQIENREFILAVHDDGVGFDPAHVREGIGLKNLRERARDLNGHVNIESSPETGTTITLRAPV